VLTVLLNHWGGEATVQTFVSRIEPHGFTRVSALGVEERRVEDGAGALARLRCAPSTFVIDDSTAFPARA
jgi:hypothetical protein